MSQKKNVKKSSGLPGAGEVGAPTVRYTKGQKQRNIKPVRGDQA